MAIERLNTEEESIKKVQTKLEPEDNIFIMVNNHYQFVKIGSIIKITSAGNYSEIYTSSKLKGLVLKSLKDWEVRLPDNYFVRIHRTAIINLEYVDHVEEWFNYSYKVFIKGIPQPFMMSKRYAQKNKNKLG